MAPKTIRSVGPEIADDGGDQRLDDELAAGVRGGEVAAEPFHDHCEFAPQPRQGRPRLDAQYPIQPVPDVLRIEAPVDPEIDPAREIDIARRDADDRAAELREADRLADDLRIAAEERRPRVVRDDEHRRWSLRLSGPPRHRRLLLMGERGSERHRQTKNVEEAVARDIHDGMDWRRGVPQQRDVEPRRTVARRLRDRSCRLEDAGDLGGRDEARGDAAVGYRVRSAISSSGWVKGSGRSSVALTVLKMAVVAPMPMASVATAASVKVGAADSFRIA